MSRAAKQRQMPPKTYKPRTNLLSRASVAKPSNEDPDSDEDLSDRSDEEERSDADESDSYTNKNVDQKLRKKITKANRCAPAVCSRAGTGAHAQRSSLRRAGLKLGSLHSIGIDSDWVKVS